MLTFNEDGAPSVEETGGKAIESLIGDAYQAIFLYGKDAEFVQLDGGEAIYLLAPEAWYTLSGAAGFADLGLLYSAPDGLELVKAYAEEHYHDVQPVSFSLHVSIADKVITTIEGDNRAFIQSFFAAYDQALIDQGADPSQLTKYVIKSEHGSEIMVGSYNQVPDFDIPE